MISEGLADQAVALRVHVEALSGADVEKLRESTQGLPSSKTNPKVRRAWTPSTAWNARLELLRLARAIDEVLRDCG